MKKHKLRFAYQIVALFVVPIALLYVIAGCGKKSVAEDLLSKTTKSDHVSTAPIDASTKETDKHETSSSTEEVSTDSLSTETTDTTTDKDTTNPHTGPIATEPKEPDTTKIEETHIEPVTDPISDSDVVDNRKYINHVTALGTKTIAQNGFTIDYSSASDGYVLVKNTKNYDKEVLVRVTSSGDEGNMTVYNGFSANGEYNTYLLTNGRCTYTVDVMLNVSGTSYAKAVSINVDGDNVAETYTYSSNKVEFSEKTNAVNVAYEICRGLTTDKAKADAIYNYIVNNISYDYVKYNNNLSARYPVADTTLSTKKGVCSDYSNLYAVMCRSVRIPTKMIFGDYKKSSSDAAAYHAWNYVYYNGDWHFVDTTKDKLSIGSSVYITKEIF